MPPWFRKILTITYFREWWIWRRKNMNSIAPVSILFIHRMSVSKKGASAHCGFFPYHANFKKYKYILKNDAFKRRKIWTLSQQFWSCFLSRTEVSVKKNFRPSSLFPCHSSFEKSKQKHILENDGFEEEKNMNIVATVLIMFLHRMFCVKKGGFRPLSIFFHTTPISKKI